MLRRIRIRRRVEEKLAIVAEVDPRRKPEFSAEHATRQITRAVAEQHGLAIGRIAFIRAGTLPKTTSGKLQRRATKQLLLAGRLDRVTPEPAQRRPEPEEIRQEIRTKVTGIISEAAQLAVDNIPSDVSLHSLGVDSLAGVNIAYEIGVLTGREVPNTLVSEQDTLDKLVDFVMASTGAGS